MTCIVISWNIVWIMAHVDRIIRACSQNKALGGRENIWTLQQKYLRSKKSPHSSATWLPTLLPLDSCLACQREPTMLSRLDLVWSTAPPLTPCKKKKISLSIKSGVMNVDDEHACDTEHQDIKASNIRQIERTQQQIFFAFKIFFLENTSEASGHGEVCCGCARVNF